MSTGRVIFFILVIIVVAALAHEGKESISPRKTTRVEKPTKTPKQDECFKQRPEPPSANPDTQGAHAYTDDTENSMTIAEGDVFEITNPDFSHPYDFKIISITPKGITVESDDPDVEIVNNGTRMPTFFDKKESCSTGYELPIGWVRFTPLEKRPVAQTYSAKPGGTVGFVKDDS